MMIGLIAWAEEVPSLPVDFTPGKQTKPSSYISENEYKDPTLHVTIEQGRKYDCDYWVARIKIGHPSQLRTAAAGGFENRLDIKGVYIARRQNAVLAINGDYFCYYRHSGHIKRQGVVYRDNLKGERDVLAIDEAGDFHILFTPNKEDLGDTINGKKVINAFHFGPGLVKDGELTSLEPSFWIAPELGRQRMCIAQTGPLEYMALCCASSKRGSAGMTLQQFAELAKELGAIQAYNLDGGDSTMMIFDGDKINDKDNKNTRTISDIIYFASAWDGE